MQYELITRRDPRSKGVPIGVIFDRSVFEVGIVSSFYRRQNVVKL